MGPEDLAAVACMALRISSTRAHNQAVSAAAAAVKQRRDPAVRRVEAQLHAAVAASAAVRDRADADIEDKNRRLRLALKRKADAEMEKENARKNLRLELENSAGLAQQVSGLQKELSKSEKSVKGLQWQVSTLPSKGDLRAVERKLTKTEEQLALAKVTATEAVEKAAEVQNAAASAAKATEASRTLMESRLAAALAKNAEAAKKLKTQGQLIGGFKRHRVPDGASTPASAQVGKHRSRTVGDNEVLLESERQAEQNRPKNAVAMLRSKARPEEFSPQVLARWLGKGHLLRIIDGSKPGAAVLLEKTRQLKSVLEEQWDKTMAISLKFEASLSDEQMDAMRKAFSFKWDEGAGRFVKRVWLENSHSRDWVSFPEPIVARNKWKPDFATLCAKHKIQSYDDGKIAERTADDCVTLLIERNYALACDRTLGMCMDHPICISTSWDAVSWQHRKVTHGGFKFASFGPDISHQSELNYVTAGICNSDDGAAGQSYFLKRFAPDFNKLKSRGVINVPGLGAMHVKLTACTDMAFQRSACGRRNGSSSHCECDKDTEQRRAALHEPPKSNGTEGYDEIARKFFSGCKLFTADRLRELSHVAKEGHDWSKGLWCSVCSKTIFKTEEEYNQFYKKLKELQERAEGDKEAAKEYKNILDAHSASHLKQTLGQGGRFDIDMEQWYLDLMHGQDLNLAKTAFKYSWLDGILDEQRPEMAQILVDAGVPFDIRKKAKNGGERNDKEKWMKASKVNIFFDGRSRDELPEGGALPGLVFKLCDARYLDNDRTPLPLPDKPIDDPLEDLPPSKAPTTSKAPAAPAPFQRPTKKAPKKPPAPLVPPPPRPNAAADPLDPGSYRSTTHPAYKGIDADLVTAITERYQHWAPKVAYIIRCWHAQSKMRSILKEAWPLRPTVEAKKERAARFFHAAVEFWRALEAISNSRHKSWYCHAWCLVLPRQIVECGDLWQHATCAIEFRGARITRQKVCWRPTQVQAQDRRIKRGEIISKFKQKYGSDPMSQLLRNISCLEELKSSAGSKGVKANRLKLTGRSSAVKLEAKIGCTSTSFSDFLREANACAGADT